MSYIRFNPSNWYIYWTGKINENNKDEEKLAICYKTADKDLVITYKQVKEFRNDDWKLFRLLKKLAPFHVKDSIEWYLVLDCLKRWFRDLDKLYGPDL